MADQIVPCPRCGGTGENCKPIKTKRRDLPVIHIQQSKALDKQRTRWEVRYSPYLRAAYRVLWHLEDHKGQQYIRTFPVTSFTDAIENGRIVYEAQVVEYPSFRSIEGILEKAAKLGPEAQKEIADAVHELLSNGRVIANAIKSESAASFPDFMEKAQTGAIARALALIGYGTTAAPDLDEGERIADAPIPPAKLHSPSKAANRETPQQKPQQSQQPKQPHNKLLVKVHKEDDLSELYKAEVQRLTGKKQATDEIKQHIEIVHGKPGWSKLTDEEKKFWLRHVGNLKPKQFEDELNKGIRAVAWHHLVRLAAAEYGDPQQARVVALRALRTVAGCEPTEISDWEDVWERIKPMTSIAQISLPEEVSHGE